jgi:predicted TIM-barrel fold metal-dependent hydrolase
MIIDFHAHFSGEEDFAARLVDLLPEAGIDRICLCSAGEIFGHASNRTILQAAQRYPDSISALALIELGKDSQHTVAEAASAGFAGFKTTNPLSSYDDPEFWPVYEAMEKSGLPLLAHTGILARLDAQRGGTTNSNWMRPICLDAIVRRFQGLNVVGAHLGVPWHEEASMMARLHPNFYVDLTGAWWGGWRVNKTPEFYHYHFFWEGAWDKVLFGTDILALDELIPSKQYHDRLVASLKLPCEVVEKIYGGTAAKLLGLTDG